MKTARIQSIISLIIVIAIVCMQPRISFAADEKPSETAVTEKFSNEEIIGMVSLGLSDEVIIEKIRSTSTAKFDTSLAALKTLKDAKVSDAVIKEMVSPKTGTKAVAQGVANTAEAGVPGMPKEYAIWKRTPSRWRQPRLAINSILSFQQVSWVTRNTPSCIKSGKGSRYTISESHRNRRPRRQSESQTRLE